MREDTSTNEQHPDTGEGAPTDDPDPEAEQPSTACESCGETAWGEDDRFGNLICESCGWMPPRARREALREVVRPS